MSSDLEAIPLSSIVTYSQGIQVPVEAQEALLKDGYARFIRIIDFTNPSEPPRYIKNPGKKYYVDKNDIVMIRYGSQTAGKVVRGLSGFIANNMFKVHINSDAVDRGYLYRFLSTNYVFNYLRGSQSSSTMPAITFGMMDRIQIQLPSLQQQIEIAAFFDTLDVRINLLRETNATLEAIAQALFKSWFVDFDPVRAKQQGREPEGMDAETAALFPDSFEESELGLVPKGWRVAALGEVCTVTIGGLWGKDTKEDIDLVPVISLRGVDLENLRSLGFAKDAPVRWVKPSAMEKRRITENEILVASSGAGPCGRPLWGGANFESLYGMPVIFSNFVKRLDCGSAAKAIYVDRLLADMRESREIWNYINGTSIPNLDDKLLLATKKILLPNDDVLSAFEKIARIIYLKLYSEETQTLATLRDTLLPRMISGQLSLPGVEDLETTKERD
jgi:type I restriction enzyme S subunit